MTADAVSVVAPILNRPNMLGRVPTSFGTQSVESKEIIVVDGDSEDCTPEFITSLSGNVIRLRQEGRFPSDARNRGTKVSKGGIIAILDDYAIPSDNRLEEKYLDDFFAVLERSKKGYLRFLQLHVFIQPRSPL